MLSKDEIAAVERACAPLFSFYKVDNLSMFYAKAVQGASGKIPSGKVEILEIDCLKKAVSDVNAFGTN